MAWYNTGTVTVTNNSVTVTGAGTAWIANAAAGMGFRGPDRTVYEIQSVNSDTSITLATVYGGATAATQAYSLLPTQDYIRTLAGQVSSLIASYSTIATNAGAGKFGDGTAASPGISWGANTNTGFYRPSTGQINVSLNGAATAFFKTTGFESVQLRSSGSAAGINFPSGYAACELGSWSVMVESGYDAGMNMVHGANNSSAANDTSWTHRFTSVGTRYKLLNGSHYWYQAPTGTAGSAITWVQQMLLDVGGNLLLTSAGGLGYGAGSGGTVTQLTSKATGVTLNKPCGSITLNAASLAANSAVSFALTNSVIAATDVVVVNVASGAATPGSYIASCEGATAGTRTIVLRNMTASALAEAVVLSFAIIRSVTA